LENQLDTWGAALKNTEISVLPKFPDHQNYQAIKPFLGSLGKPFMDLHHQLEK
jgi:hypothetical protein